MSEAYPTRNGMPVSTSELELPPSRLNTNDNENYSLHHLHFPARLMGSLLITQTLRDLEYEQELLPNDQHNLGRFALHTLYSPPEPPTLAQAMDRLDMAKETNERMRIRVKGRGYVLQNISHIHYLQIQQEYNRESESYVLAV
jgi:hypothetical protein